MSGEDLERTGILKLMLDNAEEDEEMTIIECIEEFEERIEYLNISVEQKEKIQNIIKKIKVEKDVYAQENLFKELVKIVDEK